MSAYRNFMMIIIFVYLPDLPDATETVAHGGQTGLKVCIKKLIEAPNLPASGDQVCDEAVTLSFGK